MKKPKLTFSSFGGWNVWGPIALLLLLAFASRGEAMGASLPTATEQLQMQSALNNTITDSPQRVRTMPIDTAREDSCPIKTPGQIIEDAVDTQLKGAP